MAKFIVTSGAKFTPFTYDELVRPVAETVAAHNTAQEAYDKLSMETDALDRYISSAEGSGDEEARKLYNAYRTKLETLQNNLWENGFTAQTRRDLTAARQGYMQDISRIGKAIQDRQERSKEYWDMYHKNPYLVMGKDPMAYGLDDYMKDDNLGRDWFVTDSIQFEKDVASDVKARAQALLDDLEDPNTVHKNPRLKAILTRVRNQGVTNDEINEARGIVNTLLDMPEEQRNTYYQKAGTSEAAQILVESLINRYDATGIRTAEGVSDEGRNKLLGRGISGWNAGVLAPDVKDMSDPDYEMAQKMRLARYNAALSAQASAPTVQMPARASRHSYTAQGDNYEAAAKRYAGEFGMKDDQPITVIDKNTGERLNWAQAADKYYAGDARRAAYNLIGFDAGLKDNSKKEGTFTAKDGTVWETKYDPSIDAVRVRKQGDNTRWKNCSVSQSGTDIYHEAISSMDAAQKRYRGSDIESAARRLDPDTQRKIYDRDEIDFSTPLYGYANEYFSRPDNAGNLNLTDIVFTRPGTDSHYTKRVTGDVLRALPIVRDSSGKLRLSKFDKSELGSYRGTVKGIHLVSPAGKISEDAVNPEDAGLHMNSDGTLNISGLDFTEDGIINGYIRFTTDEGKQGTFSVDMLGRDEATRLFGTASSAIQNAISAEDVDEAEDWLVSLMYQLYGWDYPVQVEGGTSDANSQIPQAPKRGKK